MYFELFKPQNWRKRSAEARRRNCAVLPYVSLPLAGDVPVGPGRPVSMQYTRDTVCQEAVLSFLMQLPEALNEARTARSSRLVGCPVTLTLRLNAGEPFLQVGWQIENHARDHRLRMLVRTGLDADVSTALSPFDLVQHRRSELDVRLCNESRHNSGMITLSDGAGGFSVLNSGAYSYENLQAQPGTLALTLLRATGRIWPEGEIVTLRLVPTKGERHEHP